MLARNINNGGFREIEKPLTVREVLYMLFGAVMSSWQRRGSPEWSIPLVLMSEYAFISLARW